MSLERQNEKGKPQGKSHERLRRVEFEVAGELGHDLDRDGCDRLKGFSVRSAAAPAASTTIMVSPMARDAASRIAPTTPGSAAGKTTRLMVSDWVAPRP